MKNPISRFPLLEVIIVSYNTKDLLKNCLDSLFKCLISENLVLKSMVTVVDNASTDNSVLMVRNSFPRVKIIENKINYGFAKANNLAVKISKAEFIFLLNSDTVVHKFALTNLLKVINEDKKIQAIGPKLLNFDGTLQQSMGFSPTFVNLLNWMFFIDDLPFISGFLHPYHLQGKKWYKNQSEIDWISGAALLFRRKITDKIGRLDEEIFMYGEEVEWCYRIKLSGGKIVYLPDAQITHLGGGSQKVPGNSIIREYDSINYFYRKYFRPLILPVRLILKIGALLRLILFGIIGRDSSRISLYAKAFKVA